MNEREDFNPNLATANERTGSRRSRLATKRKRVRELLNQQRLRTAVALTRVAKQAAALRGTKCKTCGKRLVDGAQFCPACGAARNSAAPAKVLAAASVKKPNLIRRVLAQVIDRLVMLPFLILVYSGWPKWLWAVAAFHLFCDAFTGRSPGKWVCRIRVADAKSMAKCRGLRAVLRRIGMAAGQAAYCRWEWLLFALGYDLLSFLFVWQDRAGQRLEDKLLGTRVLGEGAFRKQKWECGACGIQIAARARFCPKCGNKPKRG